MGAGSGAAGARDALCGWMGKEDLLAFEVHQVPSLGPFSLQVLQLTPELLWGRGGSGRVYLRRKRLATSCAGAYLCPEGFCGAGALLVRPAQVESAPSYFRTEQSEGV